MRPFKVRCIGPELSQDRWVQFMDLFHKTSQYPQGNSQCGDWIRAPGAIGGPGLLVFRKLRIHRIDDVGGDPQLLQLVVQRSRSFRVCTLCRALAHFQ